MKETKTLICFYKKNPEKQPLLLLKERRLDYFYQNLLIILREKKIEKKYLKPKFNGIDKRCGVNTKNYTERLLYTWACTHVSHNTQGPHSHGLKLQFPCVTLTFVYYIQKQAKTEMYKVIMPVLVQSKVKKKPKITQWTRIHIYFRLTFFGGSSFMHTFFLCIDNLLLNQNFVHI